MNDGIIRFHMFANGYGIVDLPTDMTTQQVAEFKSWWEENQGDDRERLLFFRGMSIEVVDHPMPFGRVQYDEAQGG